MAEHLHHSKQIKYGKWLCMLQPYADSNWIFHSYSIILMFSLVILSSVGVRHAIVSRQPSMIRSVALSVSLILSISLNGNYYFNCICILLHSKSMASLN